MKLELQQFAHLLREWVAITLLRTNHREVTQIVSLQLDTVELIVATQLLNLLAGSILLHHHIAILVTRKLIEEILLAVLCAVALLRTELLRDGKGRHNRGVVDRVVLHLITYLHSVRQRLGHILKDGVHLGTSLHPLLL